MGVQSDPINLGGEISESDTEVVIRWRPRTTPSPNPLGTSSSSSPDVLTCGRTSQRLRTETKKMPPKPTERPRKQRQRMASPADSIKRRPRVVGKARGRSRCRPATSIPMEVWVHVLTFLHWRVTLKCKAVCSGLRNCINLLCNTVTDVKAGWSSSRDISVALRHVLSRIRMHLPPTFGFVFISPMYTEGEVHSIMPVLRKHLPKSVHLIGATAPPIGHRKNGSHINIEGTGISMLLVHAPSHVSVQSFRLTEHQARELVGDTERMSEKESDIILSSAYHQISLNEAGALSEKKMKDLLRRGVLPPVSEGFCETDWKTFVVLSKQMSIASINALVRNLQAAYPRSLVVGGLTAEAPLVHIHSKEGSKKRSSRSSPRRRRAHNSSKNSGQEGETLILAISDGVRADSVVSRGAKPVGETFRIVKSHGNRIFFVSRVGRQDLECMSKVLVDTAHLAGGHKGENPILFGVSNTCGESAEFRICQIFGISIESILVSAVVEKGQYCQFFLSDEENSKRDLTSRLTSLSRYVDPVDSGHQGLLVFQCCGKPSSGPRNLRSEVNLVQQALPSTPISGMMCVGEIGPLGLIRRSPRPSPYSMQMAQLRQDLKKVHPPHPTSEEGCLLDRYTSIFGDLCVSPQRDTDRLLDHLPVTPPPPLPPQSSRDECSSPTSSPPSSLRLAETTCDVQGYATVLVSLSGNMQPQLSQHQYHYRVLQTLSTHTPSPVPPPEM
eukprot:Sspe_Gene.42312::Locus_20546_Transcript_1_1_Confidence_1.000_Length_2374::g.42312::m.42312